MNAPNHTPFPVPTFTQLDAVFGAKEAAYLTRDQMGGDFYAGRGRYCEVASSLFFRGGKLSDHGLRFKADIDAPAASRALRALLCSFEPKHEVKIGTVGYALREWCEDAPAESAKEPTPHQAQRKKRRKGKGRAFHGVPDPARRITLADIAKVTARGIITGICLAVAIAPAITFTAMEHTR